MKEIRQANDKAVSPIIATILLIAITVVLAATLVTILGGFTHGAGNTVETAGVTTSLSTNGTTMTASVSSSSQALTDSQISFTLTVNGTIVFTGTLADSHLTVTKNTKSGNNLTITNTSNSFTGGTVFTFEFEKDYKTKHNAVYLAMSSYSLTLNYKGTQFFNSGTQTS